MLQRWLTPLLSLAVSHFAVAHSEVENTMGIRLEPARLVIDVTVTLEEILVAQGVRPGSDGGYDAAALKDAAERHRGYLASHLYVESGGSRLPLQVTKVVPPVRFATPHTTTYHYEIVCEGRRVSEVTLRHDMLREHTFAPGIPWQVSYAVQTRSANSETHVVDLLRRDRPVVLKTGWQVAAAGSPVAPVTRPEQQRGLSSWALASLALGLTTAGMAWRWSQRRMARNGSPAA
jgi:hypothetical protein